MGGYTRTEHEACIANLPNNGLLNRVLEDAGVGYGPRPVPISAEVLKKRKADAAGKVLAKRPKVAKMTSVGLAKVYRSCGGGSSKWPTGADIPPVKSAKLSEGIIPRAVALAAVACIMLETCISMVSTGTEGAKGGEKRPGCKTMPGTKVAPYAKKCIIPAIGALAALSSDGTEESTLHDRAPEVQLKADPQGSLAEPQARSTTISGSQPAPKISLGIVPTTGASTSCI
jgi:hypothetical protein